MKIFITGGAGYLGTALVERLTANPEVERITAYDALTRNDFRFFLQPGEKWDQVQFVRGDILDTHKLEKAMEGHDVVVHLAAYTDSPYHHKQTLLYDQTNAYGTLSVVRAIESTRTVKSAVYTSSAAVYGFRENIDPASPPAPDNGYGTSKFRGESYWKLLNGRIERAPILRLGHVFGPHRSMHFDSVVHAFLFEALTGGVVSVYGDGTQSRAFVSLRQVVDSLVDAAVNAGLGLASHPDQIQLLAPFQLTINDLLSWLRGHLPQVEYRYHTPSVPLPGQSFTNLPSTASPDLDLCLADFQNLLTLSSPVRHPA